MKMIKHLWIATLTVKLTDEEAHLALEAKLGGNRPIPVVTQPVRTKSIECLQCGKSYPQKESCDQQRLMDRITGVGPR
jgi:hypothetical protein